MSLQRTITTYQLTIATLSGMIGVGWMFGAYHGAASNGTGALLGWLLAGVIVTCIGLIFTEMTIAIPVTGSYIRYPHITHGPLASFIMNWMPWLSCVMAAPTEVSATIYYSHKFYPALMHQGHLSSIGLMWAIILLIIFNIINMISINGLMRYSQYLTFWKVTVPLLTLTVLFLYAPHPHGTAMPFTLPQGLGGLFEFTSGMCIFSFLGFLEATAFAGELKNPQRAIPIAIIGSIFFCTILYVLMQWIFLISIPDSWMPNGWMSLSFSGENGPFAAIATYLGLTTLAGLIYVDALITPTGTAMIYTASTARMILAMSENNHLPRFFLRLNRFDLPARALIFNALIGIILLISLSDFDQLIKFQSSAMMLAYSMGPCSFLALRYRMPHLARPFKIRAAHLLAWIVFYVCNVMVYCSGWPVCANMFATLGIGCFSYLFLQGYHALYPILLKNAWLLCHWIMLASISFLGNRQGIGYMPEGSEYLIIALESTIILWWSVASAVSSADMQSAIH